MVRVFAVSSIELSLRPVVSVEIALLGAEASITATLWARADAAFQYPAFSALPGFYQSPTTSRPALVHAGSCTTPHLLRYSVTAGVRGIEASAKIDFNLGTALGVSLLSSYVVRADYSRQLIAPIEPYSLVTGCLIRATQADTVTATITLTTVRDRQQQTSFREHEGGQRDNKKSSPAPRADRCVCVCLLRFALLVAQDLRSLSSTALHTFAFNLLADLSSALSVSPARFVYVDTSMVSMARRDSLRLVTMAAAEAAAAADGVNGRRRLLSTGSNVRFAILPSDDASQPTPLELQAQIQSQTAQPNSQLRSGVVTRAVVSASGPAPPPPGDPVNPSAESSSSGPISLAVLVAIICGAVIVIVGVTAVCMVRRRRQRAVIPAPAAGSAIAPKTIMYSTSPSAVVVEMTAVRA